MTREEIAKKLNDGIPMFSGTMQYWTRRNGGIKYTDGIKFVADTAQAHWLLDMVQQAQPSLLKAGKMFQIWTLELKEGCTATLTCKEDTGQPNLVLIKIDFTDFPLEKFEFYCIDYIMLLKNEY